MACFDKYCVSEGGDNYRTLTIFASAWKVLLQSPAFSMKWSLKLQKNNIFIIKIDEMTICNIKGVNLKLDKKTH